MAIEVHLRSTGYCTHPEFLVMQGGKLSSRQFPAMVAILKHPSIGYILYDTGYAPRFYEETKSLPYWIYGKVTPVFCSAEESIAYQLQQIGIDPLEIRYIILSHFHADHVAGLKDFPQATIIAMRKAYEDVQGLTGVPAVKKAFIPNLLPEDFTQRIVYIEDKPHISDPFGTGVFPTGYDLFDDGEIIAIEVSGHAKGQIGLYFRTATQLFFLITDACWVSETYRELRMPSPIAALIMDSYRDFLENVRKIHQLHRQLPALRIIPSHCQDIYDER